MRDLQIKLLYEQYGWTPEQIADLLKLSPSIIRVSIQTNNFEANVPAITSPLSDSMEELKRQELTKQQQFTPIMMTVELSLLQKINEMIDECEAPVELAHLVKAYKTLTQDSVVNSLGRDEKSGNSAPAIAVQIINEVL